jgi:formylglycine-generating enzyme required for sulfatase activity
MFLDRKEETMKTRRITTAGLVALCGMAQAAFVTIGDPGNTADTAGYGAVGYTYRISATEVTIAEFQASGAGSGNENHWNDGTRTVGANAPASYVSLYEARKYCNWLTTGDVNSGYYGANGQTMSGLSHDAYAAANGPAYFLPTEDEWYKAAYFKPDASGYSLYANGTDTVPTWGTPEGWNYFNGGYVNSSPNYTWTTGFGGEEQNGTYDMMGNVWERMETSSGVARGGSFGNSEDFLRSSHRHDSYGPSLEFNALGVRVVAVPEPATMGLLAISGLVIAGHRRVRKHDSL